MKNVYDLIGIAQRAGKVSSGTTAVQHSLSGRRAKLLLISADAAPNSRDSIMSLSRKYKVPCITMGDRYDLGHSLGKSFRVALTINDSGLADAILKAAKSADIEANTTGVVEWPK